MTKQRILYLDVIRVMACCLIVLIHSPHPEAGNSGTLLVPLGFITVAGIGLFFMVSGALLLPVHADTSSFLKRRIGKIAGPLLFWTLLYVVVRMLVGELSMSDLPKLLFSIPFSAQGHGVLWFMYTLLGLYLLAPIISPFLAKASEKEQRFYLLLWALSLCYPFIALVLDVDRSVTGMLYYFTGFAGYFLLGYYLHAYKPRIPAVVIPFLFLVPLATLVAWYFLGGKKGDFYDLFWYLSLFVVMMCTAWFSGIRKMVESIKINDGRFIVAFSNACFGIYLMHILIMRYFLWKIDFIVYGLGGIGQIIMTWIFTLLISFLLTHLISYLPYAEYIIGYKQKR